ncbi:glutamate--cysteine ligase [Nonomuraea sp. NPDC050556]|uniref:glutamate--cysteine ligase n=1 Tax=Nonomuraea sp. NPDC050556 TaxID=3364369 RepID=UPI0037B64B26
MADALVGVEEEFLVVDPHTRAVVPEAAAVVERASPTLGDQVCLEITKFQVETKTTPTTSPTELLDQLRTLRTTLAAAAEEVGLKVVATGTPVLGDVVPPPINEGPRYAEGIANYRALHDEQSICAGHVHVHLPDRELAVLACNHLRPWLPTLIAMMANSPFWAGRDTGYASWRTLSWGKWPVAGPPPYFKDLAAYDDLVAGLTRTGALVDPGTIFWDVRPSARLPTIEVRVTDAPCSVEDSVLLAMLSRALVATAVEAIERGDPGPEVQGELLRAAYWRAARDGLDGHGVDPSTGELHPAADRVTALVDHVAKALEAAGDLAAVATAIDRLTTGAARQRAAYERRQEFADVVDFLAGLTARP